MEFERSDWISVDGVWRAGIGPLLYGDQTNFFDIEL